MSSPSNPIGDPSQLDILSWLPPGAVDNGVWANAWAKLADLGAADIAPVLRLLAEADVAGYVATTTRHLRATRQACGTPLVGGLAAVSPR